MAPNVAISRNVLAHCLFLADCLLVKCMRTRPRRNPIYIYPGSVRLQQKSIVIWDVNRLKGVSLPQAAFSVPSEICIITCIFYLQYN
jgi:hypothetical protein